MKSTAIKDLIRALISNDSNFQESVETGAVEIDFTNEVGPKITCQSTLNVRSDIPDEDVNVIKGQIEGMVSDLRLKQKISDMEYRKAREGYFAEIAKMCNTSYGKYWRENFR